MTIATAARPSLFKAARTPAPAPAMSPTAEAAAEATTELIELDLIDRSPLNPRKTFDEKALQELAESAKELGIIQAILVRPVKRVVNRGPLKGPYERYELVDGERRWRAAQIACLTHIKAEVRDLTDEQVLKIALVTCEQRADVPALEKAKGYKRLIDDHGYTVERIAADVGKKPGTIHAMLKLLKLPPAALKDLEKGDVSPTTLMPIARIPNEKLRAQAYKEIVQQQSRGGDPPSCRWVEDAVRREYMVELKQAPFDQKDADLVQSVGACTVCPKQVGNNRAEYPDGRGDVCTDPSCYGAKVRAHGQQLVERARAEGRTVLTAAESKKLFNDYGNGTLSYSAPYVDLDQKSDYETKYKPWRQVVGKEEAATAVVAISPKGKAYELYPKAKAQAAVRKAKAKGKSQVRDPWREDNRKRDAAAKLKKEVYRLALSQIEVDMVRRLQTVTLPEDLVAALRITTPALVDATWSDARQFVEKRRELERGTLAGEVEGMSGLQLLVLWFELIAARQAVGLCGSYSSGPDKGDKEFFSFFGADLAALTKRVANEKKAGKGKKSAKPIHKDQPDDHGDDGDDEEADGDEDDGNAYQAHCCVCGCTEDKPCPGGCYWVEDADMQDRCSSCVGKPIPAAAKNGQDVAATVGLAPQSKCQEYDEGLRRSIERFVQAEWSRMQREGATDKEIKDEVLRQYGRTIAKGNDGPCVWCTCSKGKNPQFWFGTSWPVTKPTLQGGELVKEVRRLKCIPQPGEQVKADPFKANPAFDEQRTLRQLQTDGHIWGNVSLALDKLAEAGIVTVGDAMKRINADGSLRDIAGAADAASRIAAGIGRYRVGVRPRNLGEAVHA